MPTVKHAVQNWVSPFFNRLKPILPLLKVAVIFGVIWVYCWQILEPDFGWHLQSGNYIRQHGIPTHDVFSYTAQNFAWIDHEWGSDVLVSYIYQLGGYGLLAFLFAGLWTASLCLFRKKVNLGILLVATFAVVPYIAVRPVVWSVLGIALLFKLITCKSSTRRYAIPAIFLLWANLHGGFVIGFVVLAYQACKDSGKRIYWLITLAASMLATFINPYGPRLYIEIFRTLFDPALHRQVGEWASFSLEPKTWMFIALWLAGYCLYSWRKPNRLLALTPLLLLASLSATRNLVFFVIAGLYDIDKYTDAVRLPKLVIRFGKLLGITVAALVIIIAGISVAGGSLSVASRIAPYPDKTLSYLQQHRCPGNLYNDYNFGGYLIWKLPGTPVYIDGRMPSWRDSGPNSTGETHMTHYLALVYNPKLLQPEIKKYNIQCALVSSSSTQIIDELHRIGWKTVSQDKASVLLVQK